MKRQLLTGLLVLAGALSGCTAPAITPTPQPTLSSQFPTSAPVFGTSISVATSLAAPAPTRAPAPTTIPATPVVDTQLATTPLDATQRFLAALQADRSGRLAANYASGVLAEQLRPGLQDVGGLIGEQNPFTGYSVDRIIAEHPPFAYVQVTLFYSESPQPMTARTLTLQREGGFWRVIEIVLPEGEIVPTAVPSPEQ